MRKLPDPVRKINTQSVGLDVHKKMIVFCILDRGGREIATGKFAARPDSLAEFLKEHVGRRKSHLTFESSGYSMWVYDELVSRYGEERVHVAQAKKIRAIANSKRKNDQNDAFWLAYLAHEGRLPEAYVPPLVYRELRIATRERTAAVQRRSKLFLRVWAHLAQLGRRVPTRTLRSSRTIEFIRAVAEEIGGERGHALCVLLREIEFFGEIIADWEARISKAGAGLRAIEVLQDVIPGVGAILAATIVAESGPIERFRSAKAYGSYTGLTPSDRSSGGRTRHGGISREGSKNLRWALTQAVMGCLRTKRGPGLFVGEWVRKKQGRMGAKGKARCAAARRLGETIWRLFAYGECFDPDRAFGCRVA